VHADVDESQGRQRSLDLGRLVATEFEEDAPAAPEQSRGRIDGAQEDRRAARSAVDGSARFLLAHVAREQVELLHRDVGDDRGHDVDPPSQRVHGLVEIAQERIDAVAAGARDGRLVHVGGEHGRGRLRRPQHGGYGPAAGAQVHGDATIGKQLGGSPRE
jgi:hypothetical protein